MSGRYALIVGNTEYTDPGLAQLTAPGRDAEDLAGILQDPEIGAFDDVKILLNQLSSTILEAIDDFFNHKKPDDLLVLYFSGHGIRDEFGALYLAVRNTFRAKLRSTAVKSDYIREVMDQSRSRRQVLILDCCNSGAFAQGTKAATGVSIGTASAFEGGYGRVILTASDSTQFAWEGDKVIGETDNSLFTHFLVEGLKGEADRNGDGSITVDELYDYAYEKVKLATPKQTPSKFSSMQQGEIVLRQNMPMAEVKSAPLPKPLLDSLENPFSDIRLGAVQQLTRLLNGKNLGMARSAREALEKIAEEDDSRQVQRAAAQALESVRTSKQADANHVAEIIKKDGWQIVNERAEQVEQRRENAKGQQPVTPKSEVPLADNSRQILSRTETEEITQFTNQQAVAWLTLGCAFGGLLGGYFYSETYDVVGGAIGGTIVGLVTASIFRAQKVLSDRKNLALNGLAWAIAGAIGWWIGWGALSDAGGAGIGILIFALGGLFSTFGMDYMRSNWKSIAIATAAWSFGGIIGWIISKGFLINQLGVEDSSSWAIGSAIGWALGGYVLGWQLIQSTNAKVTNSPAQNPATLTDSQKTFLLSWQGRSLMGITVGLILGILFGVVYGIINDISYDFAYAYSTFYGDVPHIFLLIICGFAGFVAYPHRVTVLLLIGGFMVIFIAGLSQGYLLYELLAFGGLYGLPAGALISRILYWLKVLN